MNSDDDKLYLAIKDALKAYSIMDDCFVGVVADCAFQHGFTLEEPVKSVLKALCANPDVQNIVSKKGKASDLDFEARKILHHITTTKGWQENLVFDTLMQLLKGADCKMPSGNVLESNNPTASNPKQSSLSSKSQHPKTLPVTNSTPRVSSLSTNRVSSTSNDNTTKKDNKSIETRDFVSLILVGLYSLAALGVIISCIVGIGTKVFEWVAGGLLVAFCICRSDVLLNKNHSKFWNWTYWICIAVGLIMGILLDAIGCSSSKTIKEEVSIVNAWLDHNVDDTLVIHCVFTAENVVGKTLDVVCTFQETDGWGWKKMKEIKDKNNEYCDYYGNVAVSYGPILVEEEKQKTSCALYLPYSELHINPSKKILGQELYYSLNCLVRVVDVTDESKMLDETDLHFAYWYGSSEDID